MPMPVERAVRARRVRGSRPTSTGSRRRRRSADHQLRVALRRRVPDHHRRCRFRSRPFPPSAVSVDAGLLLEESSRKLLQAATKTDATAIPNSRTSARGSRRKQHDDRIRRRTCISQRRRRLKFDTFTTTCRHSPPGEKDGAPHRRRVGPSNAVQRVQRAAIIRRVARVSTAAEEAPLKGSRGDSIWAQTFTGGRSGHSMRTPPPRVGEASRACGRADGSSSRCAHAPSSTFAPSSKKPQPIRLRPTRYEASADGAFVFQEPSSTPPKKNIGAALLVAEQKRADGRTSVGIEGAEGPSLRACARHLRRANVPPGLRSASRPARSCRPMKSASAKSFLGTIPERARNLLALRHRDEARLRRRPDRRGDAARRPIAEAKSRRPSRALRDTDGHRLFEALRVAADVGFVPERIHEVRALPTEDSGRAGFALAKLSASSGSGTLAR